MNGTVNDLAVAGARPVALVVTFVLEAGLPSDVARGRGAGDGARRAARPACAIVGGDTKVVEHGKADGMYITTTGIGAAAARRVARRRDACGPGDRVLLSGPIGDHGITILLARGDLDLEADLSLRHAVGAPAGRGAGRRGRARRPLDARPDPRRRRHRAQRAGARLRPRRRASSRSGVPVRDGVRGACELLGLDPLHIANEGQFLAVVAPEIAATRRSRRCAPRRAAAAPPISARFASAPAGTVLVETSYGGSRVVDMLVGDPLPRIC